MAWEEEKAAKRLQNGHATEIACRASCKYGEASKTEPKYKQSPFYPVKIGVPSYILSIPILSFITTITPFNKRLFEGSILEIGLCALLHFL